jgi:hypothetical protein
MSTASAALSSQMTIIFLLIAGFSFMALDNISLAAVLEHRETV